MNCLRRIYTCRLAVCVRCHDFLNSSPLQAQASGVGDSCMRAASVTHTPRIDRGRNKRGRETMCAGGSVRSLRLPCFSTREGVSSQDPAVLGECMCYHVPGEHVRCHVPGGFVHRHDPGNPRAITYPGMCALSRTRGTWGGKS